MFHCRCINDGLTLGVDNCKRKNNLCLINSQKFSVLTVTKKVEKLKILHVYIRKILIFSKVIFCKNNIEILL